MSTSTSSRSSTSGFGSVELSSASVENDYGRLALKRIPLPDLNKMKLADDVEHTDEELQDFWDSYKTVLIEHNSKALRQNLEDLGPRRYDEVCPSFYTTYTEWNYSLTYFETDKLRVSKNFYTEWYCPSFLDLSGEVGTLEYMRREDEEDKLKVLPKGTYTFEDIVFQVSIVNHPSECPFTKDYLASGHRLLFSTQENEFTNGTFKVLTAPYGEKTRVSVQFELDTDDVPRKRVMNFMFSGTIHPEYVNFDLAESKEGDYQYVISIPIPPTFNMDED